MSLIDIILIIVILFCGILGFKRGVFKEIVLLVGIILVFIVSYKLKNYFGDFLLLNFPFFKMPKGIETLNILLYQALAFVIICALLYTVYELIVSITGIFEKILRFTIVLGIPSKILGFFAGIIKGYVFVYVVMFFLAQTNLPFVNDSNYGNIIITKTPILNKITSSSLELINEVKEVIKIEDRNEVNLRVVDLILDKKITSISVIEKLIAKDKLNIENIESVLIKYKGE